MTDEIKFAILLRFRPDFGPSRCNREQEEPQAERCSNRSTAITRNIVKNNSFFLLRSL